MSRNAIIKGFKYTINKQKNVIKAHGALLDLITSHIEANSDYSHNPDLVREFIDSNIGIYEDFNKGLADGATLHRDTNIKLSAANKTLAETLGIPSLQEALNSDIAGYKALLEQYKAPLTQLTSNKMVPLFESAKAIVENTVIGRTPEVCDLKVEFPYVREGVQGSVFGTPKPSTLITAEISTLSSFGVDILPEILSMPDVFYAIPVENPFSHHTLPIDSLRYAFTDMSGNKYFGVFNTGYAFAGPRDLPDAVTYNGITINWTPSSLPHDCSSFVASMTGCSVLFSTYEQLQFQRGNIENTRLGTMAATYKTIAKSEAEPGDIVFCRSYKSGDNLDGFGSGGHTGILLEKPTGAMVRILACNRAYPQLGDSLSAREGPLVEDISLSEESRPDGKICKNYFMREIGSDAAGHERYTTAEACFLDVEAMLAGEATHSGWASSMGDMD